MIIKNIFFKNLQVLHEHILRREPTLYCSSKTSCVIPFDRSDVLGHWLGHLSSLPGQLKLLPQGNLLVGGAVSWKEAREYCRGQGRDLMTSPTEELALIGAGVATSATGERCFGYGNLRKQVSRVQFMDWQGEIQELASDRELRNHPKLTSHQGLLIDYGKSYWPYREFKNGPFPRLQMETDLMLGTEGQLGVITEVELRTIPLRKRKYIFISVSPWTADHSAHREILQKVQVFRGKILSCELIDHQSLKFLKEQNRIGGQDRDLIFMECDEEFFEEITQNFFLKLQEVSGENIFEIEEAKFHTVRAEVPRSIAEINARRGVSKRGTDVQVPLERFDDLMSFYREGVKLNIPTYLFGHFGDAHLHFNFLVDQSRDQGDSVDAYFNQLYNLVLQWKGSPFAEHGIGLIKQKFIHKFYKEIQLKVFKVLKDQFDPFLQFFPQGYMNLHRQLSGKIE